MVRGNKVRENATGEVGVVIRTRENSELDCADCHVAFYGNMFPSEGPAGPPYILRYLESSLEKVDEQRSGGRFLTRRCYQAMYLPLGGSKIAAKLDVRIKGISCWFLDLQFTDFFFSVFPDTSYCPPQEAAMTHFGGRFL
ncbi:hypothetical protein [Marinobacter mangrovi]|uniref:hypothetical protein n=1 Tax=Marinobacter mangrovi TaxID=2803918 RepID=UPI0019337DA2|nr:hypothetical protein [Marinobacter mangrovi]